MEANNKKKNKERSANWGGARPGAGRPRLEEGVKRKNRYIYVSDDEYVKVKEFIATLRGALVSEDKENKECQKTVEKLPNGAIARNSDPRFTITDNRDNGIDIRFPRDPRFNTIIKKYGAVWDKPRGVWTAQNKDGIKKAFRDYFGHDDEFIYEELISVEIETVAEFKESRNRYGYNPFYILGKFITDGKKFDNEFVYGDDVVDSGNIRPYSDGDNLYIFEQSKFQLNNVRRSEFDKWVKNKKKDKNAKFIATVIED